MLTYSFDAGAKLEFPDWNIADGEDALILGPSGCGKTTLLHLMSGLLVAETGIISLNGTEIQRMGSREMDRYRGKNIGLIFQKPHLIKSLTVLENLQLARFLGDANQGSSKVEGLLVSLGLNSIAHRKVHQISQGQAQRVAIARSLVNNPSVIFCDEPTASLDDDNCERVIALLKEQARSCNASLIIATHDQRIKKVFGNKLYLNEIQKMS